MSSEPNPIEKSLFEEIKKEYENICVKRGASNVDLPFYISEDNSSTKSRIAWIMYNLKMWENEIDWESDWSNRRKISICASLTMAHCRGIVCQIQQQNAIVYKKLTKLEHKMRELDDAILETDEKKREKTVNVIAEIILAHALFFIGTGVALVTMNPVPAYLTAAASFSGVGLALKNAMSLGDSDDKIKEYKKVKDDVRNQIKIAQAEISRSIDQFLV